MSTSNDIKWFRGTDRESNDLFNYNFWAVNLVIDNGDKVACNSLRKLKQEIKETTGWRCAIIYDVNDVLPQDHEGYVYYRPQRYRHTKRLFS